LLKDPVSIEMGRVGVLPQLKTKMMMDTTNMACHVADPKNMLEAGSIESGPEGVAEGV
jgi:hypothetical protein